MAGPLFRQAAKNFRRWREQPISFVREVFKVEPDPWQARFLDAFGRLDADVVAGNLGETKKRIAAKSAKGTGKTAGEAWAGWNFLLTRPHPKVPCTSVSEDNLSDGLWTEFAKWRHRSPLLLEAFEWTKTRIFAKDHPETWWASARTWSKSADAQEQAATLAGLHEDYLLFLIDEVGDIPDGVVAAAEAALSGGIETRLIMFGNPTRTDGPLYRACTRERSIWTLIEITGDPDDPDRSPRIDVAEARRQIHKWGRNSPIVLVNIFGQFPPTQSDKLLGPEEVAAAIRRTAKPRDYEQEPKVFGLDVALQGDDSTVLIQRQGCMVQPAKEWRIADTGQLADQIAFQLQEAKEYDAVFIDVTGGWGQGVYLRLKDLQFPNLIPVDFGAPAIKPEFLNRRAEMYWNCAAWVKQFGCLPDDSELAAELTASSYRYGPVNKRTVFKIEDKDKVKTALGRSPDKCDALCLTFAQPILPKNLRFTHRHNAGQVETHFDWQKSIGG